MKAWELWQQLLTIGLPTVLDAIVKSGGVQKIPNLQEVILIRKMPGVDGESKKTKLNLINLILEGDQSQNIYLFDGDVIRLNKADQTIDNIEMAINISQKLLMCVFMERLKIRFITIEKQYNITSNISCRQTIIVEV